jgi:galactose mutarotase-like enzyme
MFVLENEYTKATFNALGAELCNFYSKKSNKEYIWQGEKTIWARHAPILFPIVGKLKNNSYTYQNKDYQLSQHGFARDMEFNCINSTTTELVFILEETEESLKKYPFRFKLFVKYKLLKNVLTIEYEVQNPDTNTLYFSIGAHPGFNCEPNFSQYELFFSSENELNRILLSDGLISISTEKIEFKNNILQLKIELFDKDAIVIENLSSEYIVLQHKTDKSYVKLSAKGCPFYGIWAKKDCEKFVCLEPWHGITDTENHNSDFTTKKGIINLSANQKFNCKYSIEVG